MGQEKKEYEAGVRDGQRGGFFDDLIQGFKIPDSPYNEGYKYGVEHRYGSEGRYHTWDERGSNDPKNHENGVSWWESAKKESAPKEEPSYSNSGNSEVDYCQVCGNEYDGIYCYNCDDGEDFYDNKKREIEPATSTAKKISKTNEDESKEGAKKIAGNSDLYQVFHYTSLEAIKKAVDSGLYCRVLFVPPDCLVRYKCDRCGHEWENIISETHIPSKSSVDCIMGCSMGASRLGWLWFFKTIKGLITGKEPFGYGRLISLKQL